MNEKRTADGTGDIFPPTVSAQDHRPQTAPAAGILCLVCGSRENLQIHAKIFCAKCRVLLENCCGD
jgi:hypothetical protein